LGHRAIILGIAGVDAWLRHQKDTSLESSRDLDTAPRSPRGTQCDSHKQAQWPHLDLLNRFVSGVGNRRSGKIVVPQTKRSEGGVLTCLLLLLPPSLPSNAPRQVPAIRGPSGDHPAEVFQACLPAYLRLRRGVLGSRGS